MPDPVPADPLILAAAVALAAALSAGLILRLRPLLVRYALARPTARSSHSTPTPQGGGLAVVTALVTVSGLFLTEPAARPEWLWLAGGVLALGVLGAVDDLRPLRPLPRLAVQVAVVGFVLAGVEGRLLPGIPFAVERGLALLAGVWFVNLTNFMDGLDWMSVAAAVPLAAALVLVGALGLLAPMPTLVAAALLGAMLGFAPFNRPVARLFLGDVGSLPLGLVTAWLLYRLALAGALPAALLLPLYAVADATLTLARRALRREPVWQAHREHFYQQATAHGLPVQGVVGRVLAVNLALAGLAGATLLWPGPAVTVAALAAGAGLVATLLARFARPAGGRAKRAGGREQA